MKILHLAMHEGSGAGRAALRLHLGLLQEDIDSQMLVVQKGSDLASVVQLEGLLGLSKRLQAKLSTKVLQQFLGCQNTFSVNVLPTLTCNQVNGLTPDLINLHWVGYEYVKIETLKSFDVPLVWTLQDMWPFTGGCHYSGSCDRYQDACGSCPQLQTSTKEFDLSRWIWQRKANAWKALNLTIVAPSQWVADCARASSLFQNSRVEVIPFCLDTQRYRPLSKEIARNRFKLPSDKQIVLFGALSATQDERKGFQLLLPALKKLSEAGWGSRIELVVFGASEPENPIDMGFKTHYLGSLMGDEALSMAYSAADVMVVPSIQESFGQTASESLACGTPVVAFNATGPKDIIDHQHNGYLAKPYEISDLANGIIWTLEHSRQHSSLRNQAREKAEKAFSLSVQARQYQTLYDELLSTSCLVKPVTLAY